jgi:hypothetical protein
MNSYATEELARQRHDQFAQEARGDRLARSATPLSRPSVHQSLLRRVCGLNRLPGAVVAGISRPMRQRRGANDSSIGGPATSPRQA